MVGITLLLALLDLPVAQAKPIRLRHTVITPEPAAPATARANSAQARSVVSGLFLIQFNAAPSAGDRAQIAAAGVDLLHYVPEDTFVARLRNASLDQLRALPFVLWLGEYSPGHKVHRALQLNSQARAAQAPLAVTVLLAPRAPQPEIAATRGLLTVVQQQSTLRAGTVLRGKINPAQLEALSRSDAVLWIEPARGMKLYDEVASKLVAGDGGPQRLLTQSLGFDGTGVKVAVADSGLNNGDAATMHPDLYGRTPAFHHYGTLTDAADEHSHGTHVAGIIAGDGATGETDDNGALYGLGVAPGASIIAQRLFDADGGYEPPFSFEQLTRDAIRDGAVIGSNSWGDDTQGAYDTSAMEFDELVRDADALAYGDQPYILEFSAGNAGPAAQTIGSPAVAKNVIATGAYQNNRLDFMIYEDGSDFMADFSSRGPCADGRIKPDVVAPGTWIASLQSESATDMYAWSPIDNYYQYQGGTSQAGPHVSGAAAVFVHYHRQTHTNTTPSPALVKAALINSAFDLFEAGPSPNMDAGWGCVDLPAILDTPRTFDFVDQSSLLTSGQVAERRVVIASPGQPLKVTLAYTDPPGFPGAARALVNDLDLEVLAPSGQLYRGNQFDGNGDSVPDAPGTDNLNNVEAVHLAAPLPGEYTVRVRAHNVVADTHGDTNVLGQDFALVISGLMPPPGAGLIYLDRNFYTAPDQIRISLLNTNLAGQTSVTVSAISTTEAVAETVLLHPAGAAGGFTGAVATAAGPAVADGRLQVAHRDAIQVAWLDTRYGTNLLATATADLQPPVISSVAVTTNYGQIQITWTTDEPATSTVRYNTTTNLTQIVTDNSLTTDHSISLSGLIPGRTYYFLVASTDAAGNSATNDNGGKLFSFVVHPPSTVLLVDAFTSNFFDNDIPLSVYTDTLNQLGISFTVWDPAVAGSPSTNDLRPYRLVIWRFTDGVYPPTTTLTATEQNSIRAYLSEGGAFFMASMEQLTRLGNGFFRNQVLHVTDVAVDAGVPGAEGLPGDSITAGMDLNLDYLQYLQFLAFLWRGPGRHLRHHDALARGHAHSH